MLSKTIVAAVYDVDTDEYNIGQIPCSDDVSVMSAAFTELVIEQMATFSKTWKKVKDGRCKAIFYDPKTCLANTVYSKQYKPKK